MKVLKSINTETTQPIHPPKRKPVLFIILLLVGIILGYMGFGIGEFLGILFVLAGVFCMIAGIQQIIGISECICPDCCSKGNIYKHAKNYKCKTCRNTSIVVKNRD